MEKIAMGSIVYFVVFTLASYVFIILGLPFLIIPLVILSILLLSKPVLRELKNFRFKINLNNIILLVVFILGIAGQLAIISPSGIKKDGDLIFWSAHGHDSTWHIAIMNEIKDGWPFNNPIFAGERLVNYHFFSDVAPAMLSKYTKLNNFDSYFRVFPIIYSLFLGFSAFYLTKKITNDNSASLWAVIFTYFAGSFGYLIGKGESVFWATQPQSSSGNPPQIISDFMVLAALYYLYSYIENKNKKLFFINLLLLSTLVVFKVYAGVVLLGAVGIASMIELISNKDIRPLFLFGVSSLFAMFLYLPNTHGSTGFLIFEPWWYIRTMIVEPSRLNLLDWELRRQTYIYEHNWKRVVYLETLGLLIFFFGNLGMRFIGIWEIFRNLKNSFKSFNIIFGATILLSFVLPLLFLQKGVASNTSQFLQYFVLLFGIIAAISVSRLTTKFKFLTPVIIILMIPTQTNLIKEFYSRPAFAKISAKEIDALNYLKTNSKKDTVILTPPYDQYLDLKEITPNIWDWFDTSYVAALSERKTYMDDYEQLDIMGYEYKNRLKDKIEIFTETNKEKFLQKTFETNSDYLYFPKVLKPKVNLEETGLTKEFENEDVEIWKIN